VTGTCVHNNEPSGFIRCYKNSWVAGQLLGYQQGFQLHELTHQHKVRFVCHSWNPASTHRRHMQALCIRMPHVGARPSVCPYHNRNVFLLFSALFYFSSSSILLQCPLSSLLSQVRILVRSYFLVFSFMITFYLICLISCPRLLLLWMADLKHNYADVHQATLFAVWNRTTAVFHAYFGLQGSYTYDTPSVKWRRVVW
jgi:hypothetical protein